MTVALCVASLLVIQALAGSPDATVPVTWAFEAPDMRDVAEFNESGELRVPIRYEPKECEATAVIAKFHTFQYITGSTRGRDRMPSKISSGAVISLTKKAESAYPMQVTVKVEGGRGDWSGDQSFALPVLSPGQWHDLDPTSSWVFPGEVNMLPKFLNRVIVSCR